MFKQPKAIPPAALVDPALLAFRMRVRLAELPQWQEALGWRIRWFRFKRKECATAEALAHQVYTALLADANWRTRIEAKRLPNALRSLRLDAYDQAKRAELQLEIIERLARDARVWLERNSNV